MNGGTRCPSTAAQPSSDPRGNPSAPLSAAGGATQLLLVRHGESAAVVKGTGGNVVGTSRPTRRSTLTASPKRPASGERSGTSRSRRSTSRRCAAPVRRRAACRRHRPRAGRGGRPREVFLGDVDGLNLGTVATDGPSRPAGAQGGALGPPARLREAASGVPQSEAPRRQCHRRVTPGGARRGLHPWRCHRPHHGRGDGESTSRVHRCRQRLDHPSGGPPPSMDRPRLQRHRSPTRPVPASATSATAWIAAAAVQRRRSHRGRADRPGGEPRRSRRCAASCTTRSAPAMLDELLGDGDDRGRRHDDRARLHWPQVVPGPRAPRVGNGGVRARHASTSAG